MKQKLFTAFLIILTTNLIAQKNKSFNLSSPNNINKININIAETISWSASHGNQTVINPSIISLKLNTGEVLGSNAKPISAKTELINETIKTVAYKKDIIENNCNQLTINFKGDYGIIFRAYNNAVAYRFFTKRKGELIIESEKSEFNFEKDYIAIIPHISGLRNGEKYSCSFEEFYTETPISKFNKDTLGYLPLLVKLNDNKKAVLLEADVQNYPEMFVQKNRTNENAIQATFASYPTKEGLGGYINWNYAVFERANFIAKVNGTRTFPWRVIALSDEDKELLNTDLVQQLSEPNKIENTSWIKPGKVAWDWWNDWNISGVDFKAGINNETYKYYIDFASANKIEYIILDEGWSDDWDLNKVKNNLNIPDLIAYGKQKNVSLILWSTWYALGVDMEGLCTKYSNMGIKGFKVDFVDRNDQKAIASCYQMAAVAAKNHLLLDFHGMFPPQGLQRTWPNVVNFEGVRGMEYMKWEPNEKVPNHELNLPFIRMMAGPLDYTPGAMRNATTGNLKPNPTNPISAGTRCHQMAIYVLYDAPLQMLCDNPTAYMKEQECTDFIAKIPTTFNQTIALDGQLGEYAVIAKKKDNIWYVGGMTNWTERDVTIDFSFLGEGNFSAEIFKDGINANKAATDYKKEIININASQKLNIHLAQGGGFAIRITKQ